MKFVRPSPLRNELVGDAVDLGRIDPRSLAQRRQQRLEGHNRVHVGAGATGHRHEVALGEVADQREALVADGDERLAALLVKVIWPRSWRVPSDVQRVGRARSPR